jgi:hypothetical protein
MEALSQLDIRNPDHVSVITRDSKVTISVIKDGTSVTLGFPLTSPGPLAQQPAPQEKVFKTPGEGLKYLESLAQSDLRKTYPIQRRKDRRAFRDWNGPSKLSPENVREIKLMLKDEGMRRSCGTITNFYNVIGKKFGVTGCSISNIARGIAWKGVK